MICFGQIDFLLFNHSLLHCTSMLVEQKVNRHQWLAVDRRTCGAISISIPFSSESKTHLHIVLYFSFCSHEHRISKHQIRSAFFSLLLICLNVCLVERAIFYGFVQLCAFMLMLCLPSNFQCVCFGDAVLCFSFPPLFTL